MSLQEFEKELQTTVHPELSCKVNWKGAPDVGSVYYKDVCLYITVPREGPANERSELFTDARGVPFRGKGEVIEEVKHILSSAKKMTKLADNEQDKK